MNSFKATVVIPAFKDIEALNTILHGLERQTERNFEVIVSEDDDSSEMAEYVRARKCGIFSVVHLAQPDVGYRKSRAVNRAVATSRSDYIIFIDGDCIPHKTFIFEHLRESARGVVLAGRRAKLGPRASRVLRKYPKLIAVLDNPFSFGLIGAILHFDGLSCFEAGFRSKLMQKLLGRPTGIVGCNFSCFKSDYLRINGFNEALPGCGGDDDDLDWRFRAAGIDIKNVKFVAIVYHLFHDVRRGGVDTNLQMIKETQKKGKWFCDRGVNQYLSSIR